MRTPQIRFFASTQTAVAPSCNPDGGQSLVSIATGKKRFTEVACGQVTSVSIQDGREGRRSTAIGSAAEKQLVTAQKLSISVMELRNCGAQIFAVIDCGTAWEATEGAIEDLWAFGSVIKFLIDPAKKIPEGCRC